jgi:hypothetical protein
MNIERKYLLTCVLFFLLIIVTTFSGRLWSEMGDSWEHAASVCELSFNLTNPSNPFLSLEGSTTTPRFTLYILFLALFKRISGLSVIDLMELAGLCNYILLTIGIYLFIKNYAKNPNQPLFTLITLLIFWGHGWLYSSEYSLHFLTSSLFHPSIFTFSISFWGWHFFLNSIKGKGKINLVMTVFLSLLITSAHPLTASFYFIFLFFLAFYQKGNIKFGFSLFGLSLVLSIFLTLLWPYFSIIEGFKRGGLSGGWYTTGSYFYYHIITGAGLSLLGIPVAIYYLLQRRHLCIILGFLISVMIYIASYFADLPLLGRYMYFSIFFLHLLLSFFLAELWESPPKFTYPPIAKQVLKVTSVILMIVLFFYQIKLMNLTGIARCCINFSPELSFKRCTHPKEKYVFLTTHLKRGDVVLSDTFTSWIIPGMTGAKVVSLFHDNPLVLDNVDRMADTKTFFSPNSNRSKRMKIVKHYGITHILIHKGLESFEYAYLFKEWGIFIPSFTPQLTESLTSFGKIVHQNDNYILIKLEI